MKKCIYIFIAFAFNFSIKAQINLVVNPSFESYTSCPTNAGQVDLVVGWDTCRGSADYFNACSTTTVLQTPQNIFGYQQPTNGNAYCGFITFNENALDREMIVGQLNSPLTVSQKYYISFKVSRADSSYINGYNTNKLGVKFSKVKQNNVPINNVAHYYSNTIIMDTINWTRIFGSFLSDSAYQYIMLGNFFDDINTSAIKTGAGIFAYYFVDDLCVSTDSLFTESYTTGLEKTKDKKFEVYPNPANDYISIKSSDIIFEIKLYNALGNLMFIERNIGRAEFVIDLSFVPKGIYSMAVKFKSTDSMKKIIID